MGFFDFLKNVGVDLFGGGDEAEEIKGMLTKELGDKITNLEVQFEDGTVTLKGNCDSVETREKAMLLTGNVKGVEKVNADALVAPEPEKKEETTFYTVKSGDSLSLIAKRFYGDPMKYKELFEANKEIIKDPNLIYPGQVLRIPKLDK
jgi:nucleoid-associated protein YgaU